MKSYEQMARSVLSRRDQILKRKQQKKLVMFKYAARVSTACGALALCVGALAVWNNVKNTQKNLDEFVSPTEPTTQTSVSLTDSDSENNNDNSVVQDKAETTAPAVTTKAVTTKVVVTSVSKDKEGKNVIVTTEVAVPVPQVTTKPFIGPSPAPTAKVTTKPFIGPSPKPTAQSTTKPTPKPIPRPTTKKTTYFPAPSPTHTTATTIATEHKQTTVETSWIPPQTPLPEPQPTAVPSQYVPPETTICTTTVAKTEMTTYYNDNTPSFNMYRNFNINGRYYNDMERGTYDGETIGMTMYYSGTATFYDWNNDPVYEDISVYARSGEYQVIVYFSSQNRYEWYNISYPF